MGNSSWESFRHKVFGCRTKGIILSLLVCLVAFLYYVGFPDLA